MDDDAFKARRSAVWGRGGGGVRIYVNIFILISVYVLSPVYDFVIKIILKFFLMFFFFRVVEFLVVCLGFYCFGEKKNKNIFYD